MIKKNKMRVIFGSMQEPAENLSSSTLSSSTLASSGLYASAFSDKSVTDTSATSTEAAPQEKQPTPSFVRFLLEEEPEMPKPAETKTSEHLLSPPEEKKEPLTGENIKVSTCDITV